MKSRHGRGTREARERRRERGVAGAGGRGGGGVGERKDLLSSAPRASLHSPKQESLLAGYICRLTRLREVSLFFLGPSSETRETRK